MKYLSSRDFFKLLEAIAKQFESHCDCPHKRYSTKWFGISKNASTRDSEVDANLYDHIMQNLKVRAFLDKNSCPVSDRYVYNRYLEYKKNKKDRIRIVTPYDDIIARYLGFTNFEQVVSHLNKPEFNYQAYYYSPTLHEVKEFEFFLEPDGDYHAKLKMKGFHTESSELLLEGRATLKQGYLYGNLNDAKGEIGVYLITSIYSIANVQKGSKAILSGLMITHSTRPNPISAEVIFYPNEKAPNATSTTTIKRYLNLKRNGRRVSNEVFTDHYHLRIGDTPVNYYDFLKGYYRVWRFNKDGDIVQSKLVIHSDFSANLYINIYGQESYREQHCTLTIELASRQLVINTYSKDKNDLISVAIFNSLNHEKRFEQATGVFCSVGIEGGGAFSRPLVLHRESQNPNDHETANWTSRIIPKKEIESIIKDDQHLVSFYGKLGRARAKHFGDGTG